MWVKFAVTACCEVEMIRQLGNPQVCMPNSVDTPSRHFSLRLTPPRP